ncbi:MAG: 50S ribosomal protein L25/general stress protein Ctc [Methylotenera sp.]|nr:50S ribosomal protein L25/general stress protein Ctc [Methylotenera sp.]MDO9233266.1 50S ribosomal protein L25/general stress protein Ctc [Methylotenera sp.]MDO9388206.1 50S ribosomal protein L25/general stress protein Ctc [Methylotenera sp.]MDP2101147.1 50S ribosomal protein L25/general stress protein Ctc [Methylotenera sp.]MDP2280915.1 50S ribosomal protein L25/general stress protein Ctc [Methylotenera sp.]
MAIEINAVKRDAKGTGASRRLRHAGAVPGVVYGGGKDAVTLELNAKELFLQFRHEAFHASVLTLILDGKKENVLLRDFQMHPVRNTIQHIDFQRVSATEKIHVKVPFHFINADVAPGVKLGGGIVAHVQTEADVSCLAKDLPEFIEIDVSVLEIGHSIHLSQIKLPKGVEFVQLAHGDDAAVASIAKTRGGVSAAADATDTPAA